MVDGGRESRERHPIALLEPTQLDGVDADLLLRGGHRRCDEDIDLVERVVELSAELPSPGECVEVFLEHGFERGVHADGDFCTVGLGCGRARRSRWMCATSYP